MKTIINVVALWMMALALAGCTHNNGDIGDLFGTWKLEKMMIGGEVDTDYGDNVVWKFQSSIIEMQQVDDSLHETLNAYGTWSRPADGVLKLDFTHTDTANPDPGADKYSPLQSTRLPRAQVIDLDVLELNGSKMRLRYIDAAESTAIEYYFKKW